MTTEGTNHTAVPDHLRGTASEERLQALIQLVTKWNRTVNLVSAATIPVLRERHIADSAQLVTHMPPAVRHWVDLGTGGGFPGLVVAILLADTSPAVRVTLIESDQRKAAFLREAARSMGVAVQVIAERIETCAPQQADVVSARALAPLSILLAYGFRHLAPGGTGLFLKGAGVATELDEARQRWTFHAELMQSQTNPDGCVLKIQELRHAE